MHFTFAYIIIVAKPVERLETQVFREHQRRLECQNHHNHAKESKIVREQINYWLLCLPVGLLLFNGATILLYRLLPMKVCYSGG